VPPDTAARSLEGSVTRTEPQRRSPQAQWPPAPATPPAEAALAAWAATSPWPVRLDAPVGRPAERAWPNEDYRGWAGL
jgi:hypothetical protein